MDGNSSAFSDRLIRYIVSIGKWLLIAGITGAIGGLIGGFFRICVEYVTGFRNEHPWMLFLLPAAGLIIVFVYNLTHSEGKGTNDILRSVHSGDKVSILLLPAIFIGTVLTHLTGGSAGREGAALQIGGSLGNTFGRILKLNENELRLATFCGMSAVFSALFGTPVTAVIFVLEVASVGLFYYSGLVPCCAASLSAFGITSLLGLSPEHYEIFSMALTAGDILRVALLAAVCALASILFCIMLHKTGHLAEHYIKNAYLRILIGSALIIALTLTVGCRDYNGGGMNIIAAAVEKGNARPEAFLLKMIFTSITLACGFKGGEVVPSFFVGATLGCVLGPVLGINASAAAALGMISVFCGAVNCPVASLIMSVELFGIDNFIYFAAACFVAYLFSGYTSLYGEQKMLFSKVNTKTRASGTGLK